MRADVSNMKSVSVEVVAFLLVVFTFECSDGFTPVKVAGRFRPLKLGSDVVECAKKKLGENECQYKTTKVLYKIKNHKSLQCHRVHFSCLNPNYPPFVRCSEIRCSLTKKSIPFKTIVRQRKTVCCPGWTRNESSNNRDCNIGTCITLPQFTPARCRRFRLENLNLKRRIYRFTTPPPSPPTDEITGANLIQFLKCPVLNLTVHVIAGQALKNPHEQEWAHAYFALNGLIKRITKRLLHSGRFNNLKKYSDYGLIIDAFQEGINATGLRKFCRFPSNEEDFKDIITDNIWQDDKVFVEQRLAGANPMSIRRLALKEYIERRSQFNPVLDKEIEKVSKKRTNMKKMVRKGLVYILDYPVLNNITTMNDVTDLNSTDQRQMKPSTSPIAIFVSLIDCFTGKRELKPIAIQTDFTASSPVFTPKDGLKWLLAKAVVQRADLQYVQVVEHLLKTHFLLGTVCIAMERQLSAQHPLYDILKYHCRGVLVTNGLALPSLLSPEGALRKIFTIGNVGSVEMLNKAFPSVTWDDADFVAALKKRGVNDASKLPYFPYRDDGIVMWKIVREFARELVDLYYHYPKFVLEDEELQAFANELSNKGTGPDGGKGMVKDFPNRIKSKWQLAETLARIIFIPVQHSAVNYPISYYAGFAPNMPSKLYEDPRAAPDEFSIHRIPKGHVATFVAGLDLNLAALRYDNLFDYHRSLQDKKAAQLIEKYYKYLIGPVSKQLKTRNKRRLKEGHLTYPYFLSKWLPNSIHT